MASHLMRILFDAGFHLARRLLPLSPYRSPNESLKACSKPVAKSPCFCGCIDLVIAVVGLSLCDWMQLEVSKLSK